MASRVLTLIVLVTCETFVAGVLFNRPGRPLPDGGPKEPVCTQEANPKLEKLKQYAKNYKKTVDAKSDYLLNMPGDKVVRQTDSIAPSGASRKAKLILTYKLTLAGSYPNWLCSIELKNRDKLFKYQNMLTSGNGSPKHGIYKEIFNKFLDKIINYVD